ncbi:nucleotidyltransferase [Anaerotalea alkaliphila]|uniref:tRNA(Met) cytidine acetate ligase n=1 Tax=Anaerotalea alkaliphila TaxID=2662126 RepID=A0A7X5HUE3_9FIRM|nr:nucleotidyltransferase [Anaerotalea alkaliphila]NDL66875.1 nucleotidyltransferase [Anaerotalea alkaliphila]
MKTIGIVAEYNPFHKGHAHQVRMVRETTGAEHVVAIMSGNYVQRGEPAMFNKWIRTEMALAAGVDLVLELPVAIATSSAEGFAAGAVRGLAATGVVDGLCFGSEGGELGPLDDLAALFLEEPPAYREALGRHLQEGLAFPKARAEAAREVLQAQREALEPLLHSPNNILGIEYLKALRKYRLPLEAVTIRRKGAGYHAEDPGLPFPSATAIRKHLREHGMDHSLEPMLPDTSYRLMLAHMDAWKGARVHPDMFFPFLQYRILQMDPGTMAGIQGIREGLEHRIKEKAREATSWEGLLGALQTKRYPATALSRALLHILLDLKEDRLREQMEGGGCRYLRILGFRKEAGGLLHRMKRNASLPLVSNVADSMGALKGPARSQLLEETASTEVYNLALATRLGIRGRNDFTQSLVVL